MHLILRIFYVTNDAHLGEKKLQYIGNQGHGSTIVKLPYFQEEMMVKENPIEIREKELEKEAD